MAKAVAAVKMRWALQSRRLSLWLPVGIAFGILIRFGFGPVALVALCFLVALMALSLPPRSAATLFFFGGLFALLLGALAAEIRLYRMDAPVLSSRYQGEVTGQVRSIEQTARGDPRLLLQEIKLDTAERDIPFRVRITLVDDAAGSLPQIGDRIQTIATLNPPPGPAEPGAFDFSQQAWFMRIGGVGYSSDHVLVLERGQEQSFALSLASLRRDVSVALRERLGPQIGGIASAITVGDRSGLPQDSVASLRDSGLAHLLAISGLHMGLLTALVFGAIRLFLSLHPFTGERLPAKKIAAALGLAAGFAYLLLSGAGIATQRAFVMAAVALIAVLMDQRAITLRSVALAASILLLLRPEAIFSAGFQMSFAAVAALVAVYEATRDFWRSRRRLKGWIPWLVTALLASAMTSFIAGSATSPFGAYHFNRLVLLGLPANLLAMPLMAFIVMPAIILLPFFYLFGLDWLPLQLLEFGIDLIMRVSDAIASFNAVSGIGAAQPLTFAMMIVAGLWLIIWKGVLRLLAVPVLLISLFFWEISPRPDFLIKGDGALIAGRDQRGDLWISSDRRSRYTSESWLRRDSVMPPDMANAYARGQWRCNKGICLAREGRDALYYIGRRASLEKSRQLCQSGVILVIGRSSKFDDTGPCTIIRIRDYQGASALAVYLKEDAVPDIKTARPFRPPPSLLSYF